MAGAEGVHTGMAGAEGAHTGTLGVVHAGTPGVGTVCTAIAGWRAVGGEACHETEYRRVCFFLDWRCDTDYLDHQLEQDHVSRKGAAPAEVGRTVGVS